MSSTIRYLSAGDVSDLLPPIAEIVDVTEECLRQHGEGHTRMPPKVDLGPGGDNFLHAMPAAVGIGGGGDTALGMKWVAGYPGNTAKGIPYVNGVIVLNDPDDGRVVAVMDANVITAKRTGACTAVTARHMADPNSEVMTIIGCGVQGRSNIEALLAVFPDTERMLCYDIDVERQAQFADFVSTTHAIAAIVPPDPQECTEGAHVIVTAGPISKDPKPVIEPNWLQTGTLCVALDFDGYFTPASFDRADRFITDDLTQYASYKAAGYFGQISKEPDSDLGAIVAGKAPGRPEGSPIVLAANLGLGILDVALANAVWRRAESENRGTVLPA